MGQYILSEDYDTVVNKQAYTQTGNFYDANYPLIIMKWTGCNPSTIIGILSI